MIDLTQLNKEQSAAYELIKASDVPKCDDAWRQAAAAQQTALPLHDWRMIWFAHASLGAGVAPEEPAPTKKRRKPAKAKPAAIPPSGHAPGDDAGTPGESQQT